MNVELSKPGQRPRFSRTCPMCLGAELFVHFVYDKPPPSETKFRTIGSKYARELHKCAQCGHFLEWFEADQSSLYRGEYVSATYGGPDGIVKSFDRINSLPPEGSDNIGRVRFISDFSSQQWPLQRFTGRSPRLLDVGAGLGVFPYRMKQIGWSCTALEMDRQLVAHHNEVVGIESVEADVRGVEGIGLFDLITFNKVLEHLRDPVGTLASAKRLLLPGALVYIELPDGEAAEIEGKEREEFLFGHIHVFSFASYALLIARAGLRLLHCERLREPSSKFTLRGFAQLDGMRAAIENYEDRK